MNHLLNHKFSAIGRVFWQKKTAGTEEAKVLKWYFLQCTRPSGHIQATLFHTKHVEKIDFIAKTCKHNMYTDMFYFFICFIVFFYRFFRNIQVDISHICILCYFLSLWSILTIVKIINKTYRFVYFYNTMYSKKSWVHAFIYISLTSTFFFTIELLLILILYKKQKTKL